MNEFLTKDIKITTDSVGHMTAEHEHQGILIDGSFFASRKECRQEAVTILKEKKDLGACESYEAQERRLEEEADAWKYN